MKKKSPKSVCGSLCLLVLGLVLLSCQTPPPLPEQNFDRSLDLDKIRIEPFHLSFGKAGGLRQSDLLLRMDAKKKQFILFNISYKDLGFDLLARLKEGRILAPVIEVRDARGRLVATSFLVFKRTKTRTKEERVVRKEVIQAGGLEFVLPGAVRTEPPRRQEQKHSEIVPSLREPIPQPVAVLAKDLPYRFSDGKGIPVSVVIKMFYYDFKAFANCGTNGRQRFCSFYSDNPLVIDESIFTYYQERQLHKAHDEKRMTDRERKHISDLEKKIEALNKTQAEEKRLLRGLRTELQSIRLVSSPKYFRLLLDPSVRVTSR